MRCLCAGLTAVFVCDEQFRSHKNLIGQQFNQTVQLAPAHLLPSPIAGPSITGTVPLP